MDKIYILQFQIFSILNLVEKNKQFIIKMSKDWWYRKREKRREASKNFCDYSYISDKGTKGLKSSLF